MSDDLDQDALPEPAPEGPGLFGDPAPAPKVALAQEATPYRVLARKYRPATFDDLIGQDAMVRILRRAFELGRIAHAFMLTGVRGVGKTTTARILARALNCVGVDGRGGPTPDPCGVCDNCRAILADRHPDVVEMDAASRTGVDDVREIIEATRFRPMQARTKVFIIDEVHMLSRNAFNALLKTLEEPPPHVKFVFATTEIRKVPVTVLSRCQRFDLRRIPVSLLAGLYAKVVAAEHVAIEPEALAAIARAADGSVRDGLSLLDQAIAVGESAAGPAGMVTSEAVATMLGVADRGAVFDLMEAAMAGRAADALAITDRAYAQGADFGQMLGDLLELTHTLSRLKSIPALRTTQELPEAERTRGAALADALTIPVLGRAWQMLLKGAAEVETAADRRAAAEMVLIRLCHVAELPPPGELVRRLQSGEPSPPARPPPPRPGNGGGGSPVHAEARGGAVAALAQAEPVAAEAPRLTSFRDVLAIAAREREMLLHGHLLHSVHLIRFAPPVIELRPHADAPRDLAPRLAALLLRVTGTRWTVALASSGGEPTVAEQGQVADQARRHSAANHPLVQAIMAAFPGARIEAVRDATADAYGLPAEVALGGEGAGPASDDSELVEPADFYDIPANWESEP